MIATVHMLVGALITVTVAEKNPNAAKAFGKILLFGLASHGALDLTPHVEPRTFTSIETIEPATWAYYVAWVDNLLGAWILYWLFFQIRQMRQWLIVPGVLAAWSPDFFQYLVQKHIWHGLAAHLFSEAHHTLHFWIANSFANHWSVGTVTTVVLVVYCLMKLLRHEAEANHREFRAHNTLLKTSYVPQ